MALFGELSGRDLSEHPQTLPILLRKTRDLSVAGIRRLPHINRAFSTSPCRRGEMADAIDSKSVARKGVGVRVPPPAPLSKNREKSRFFCLHLPPRPKVTTEVTTCPTTSADVHRETEHRAADTQPLPCMGQTGVKRPSHQEQSERGF